MPAISPSGPLTYGTRVGVQRTMLAAGAETVIVTLALLDASAADVAVMLALPAPTAVIVALAPLALTLATLVFDDDQFTACDAPFVTATVAVSAAVWPIESVPGAPLSVTDTTVGVLPPGLPLQFGALTGHFSPPPPQA